MNASRLLGFALVVIGAILLIVGINSSSSFADQMSETFTGRFTDKTMWYILGGIALGVVGLLLVFVGFRRK
jgi:uncharacterized membrane protein